MKCISQDFYNLIENTNNIMKYLFLFFTSEFDALTPVINLGSNHLIFRGWGRKTSQKKTFPAVGKKKKRKKKIRLT